MDIKYHIHIDNATYIQKSGRIALRKVNMSQ